MMGEVTTYETHAENLRTKSLEELFAEARRYGCIHLYESDSDRTFSFSIKFESVPGTQMEARSDFNQLSIADAIIQALARAKVMVGQFK